MRAKKVLCGAAFLWVIAGADARAVPITYNFVSTVTSSDGSLSGVDIGTSFAGSVTYDSMTPGGVIAPWLALYNNGAVGWIGADIAGHAVRGDKLAIEVTNNYGANVDDAVQMTGGFPIVIDGTDSPDGFFGFYLFGKAGNTAVLASTDLPIVLDFGSFDGPNYGYLIRDPGRPGYTLTFSIDQLYAVPEPATLQVVVFGLGVLGALGWSRGAGTTSRLK